MLVGPDGMPAGGDDIVSEDWLRAWPNAVLPPPERSVERPTIREADYPLKIAWDGILVEDADHSRDVVRHVRAVLDLLWVERADAIEQEITKALGVAKLREYLANPRGFFEDHVKRYTKSRRRAPIYWLLQSNKRSYGLWLYYQRLDADLLFKP